MPTELVVMDTIVDGELLDEDGQVEENVAGFVDEEHEYNDKYAPQNSDCEEDENSNTVFKMQNK